MDQKEFYVLFCLDSDGRPYTKIHPQCTSIICNIKSKNGKVYFPDKSFKDAKQGFAKVHIVKDKEKYGFLDGEMVDFSKYKPSKDEIIDWIIKANDRSIYGRPFEVIYNVKSPSNGDFIMADCNMLYKTEYGDLKLADIGFYSFIDSLDRKEIMKYDTIMDSISDEVTIDKLLEFIDTNKGTIAGSYYSHIAYINNRYYVGYSGQLYDHFYKVYLINGKIVLDNTEYRNKIPAKCIKSYLDYMLEKTFGDNAKEICDAINDIGFDNDSDKWLMSDIPRELIDDSLIMEAYDMGIIDSYRLEYTDILNICIRKNNTDLFTKFSYDELKHIFDKIKEVNKKYTDRIVSMIHKGKLSTSEAKSILKGKRWN